MRIVEQPVYGTQRIGIYNRHAAPDAYDYELSDYLGNVRAVISAGAGNTITIQSYADYYPHGGKLPGRMGVNGPAYRNGYQGQYAEKDDETGYDAFDLRMYDPTLGRWFAPDPMGQFHSPYLSMGNNHVNGIDPSGGFSFGELLEDDGPGKGWHVNANGDYAWFGEEAKVPEGWDFVGDHSFKIPDGANVLRGGGGSLSGNGNTAMASALGFAGVASVADGPLPIGETIGAIALAGTAVYVYSPRLIDKLMGNAGNESYPGPLTYTIPDPTNRNRYMGQPDEPDNYFPNGGGHLGKTLIGIVGGISLGVDIINGIKPQYSPTLKTNNPTDATYVAPQHYYINKR